ncbi:MAG: BPSS1780 family membrane protein [Halofilum sp. (in: g-proteobacteria)]
MTAIHAWDGQRGAQWLARAWRLFMAAPGMWIVLSIVFLLIFIVLNLVPAIGFLVALVLAPALSGGMLLAARDAEAGRPLDLGRLFEPLVSDRTRGDIVILGLLYTGASIAATLGCLMVLIVTAGLSVLDPGLLSGQDGFQAGNAASLGVGVLFALLIWLLLALTVAVVFFYAIPLVVLASLPPIQAITLGVHGLARNLWPLLVFGLIWTVLALLAILPLMLGWLVLGPITWTAWYTSYRDIFESAEAIPGMAAA